MIILKYNIKMIVTILFYWCTLFPFILISFSFRFFVQKFSKHGKAVIIFGKKRRKRDPWGWSE